MPSVTVNPISRISVKVNQGNPQVVKGTTTFVGATDVQSEINQISIEANNAVTASNTALYYANTGYDFVTMGGTVSGNVAIADNLVVNNSTYVAGNVVITGDFVGTIDGGTY